MNPIEYALLEIRNQIPEEILRLAFPSLDNQWGGGMESLDFRIRCKVIEQRVRVDVNLIGGTQERFSLANCNFDVNPDYTSAVIHIPAEVTHNRQIVQVYNVTYGPTGYPATMGTSSSYGAYGASPRGQRTGQLVSSSAGADMFVLGNVEMLGNNTFLVYYNGLLSPAMWIDCRVADDENLNSIRPQSYQKFGALCVAACKAYIFRNFSISLDQGQLQGGMQLGVIRELVWNYQEAEQTYQELRASWRSIAVQNDSRQYRNFLNSQLGLL